MQQHKRLHFSYKASSTFSTAALSASMRAYPDRTNHNEIHPRKSMPNLGVVGPHETSLRQPSSLALSLWVSEKGKIKIQLVHRDGRKREIKQQPTPSAASSNPASSTPLPTTTRTPRSVPVLHPADAVAHCPQ